MIKKDLVWQVNSLIIFIFISLHRHFLILSLTVLTSCKSKSQDLLKFLYFFYFAWTLRCTFQSPLLIKFNEVLSVTQIEMFITLNPTTGVSENSFMDASINLQEIYFTVTFGSKLFYSNRRISGFQYINTPNQWPLVVLYQHRIQDGRRKRKHFKIPRFSMSPTYCSVDFFFKFSPGKCWWKEIWLKRHLQPSVEELINVWKTQNGRWPQRRTTCRWPSSSSIPEALAFTLSSASSVLPEKSSIFSTFSRVPPSNDIS